MASKRETQVISQLLRETQEGKLKWQPLRPGIDSFPMPVPGANVKEAYYAERDGWSLRISEYMYRHYTDEDEWHWVEDVHFETGKTDLPGWWVFPKQNFLWDLFRAVQFQANEVSRFFDDVLKGSGDS